MADTTKQLQDIEALLAERRKYEQWIAQLEARKATTPEHVYRKVRSDYDVRLVEAQERLAAETGAVQALVTNLEATRAAQDEKIGVKTDERSEAELRASVGEFGEKEWDKLRGKLDHSIAEMTGAREATQNELESLRALLTEAATSAEPVAPSAAAVPLELPPAAAPTAEIGMRPTSSAAVPRASERAQVSVAPRVSAPAPVPGSVDATVASVRASGHPGPDEAAAAPAVPRQDFDELAFLKSVVGRTTPPTSPSGLSTIAEPGSRPSGAFVKRSSAAIRPSTPELRATPDTPLEASDDVKRESGAFQASNLSTFGGRTPRSSEAIKSLKCGECGSLNYPTEWYCERCGGELAAF